MKNIFGKIGVISRKGGQLTGVSLALIFLFVASSLISRNFFTAYNLTIMSRDLAFYGMIAIAQGILLLMGYIDLSIGTLAGLSGVVTAKALMQWGLHPVIAIALGLLTGALCGLFNGVVITTFNLNPLVLTIGSSTVFIGVNLLLTKGKTITGLPKVMTNLGIGSLFRVPIPDYFLLGILLIAIFLTTRTIFGRNLYAVGNSMETAKLVGIKTKKVVVTAYVITSSIAALTGILMVFRLMSAQTTVGQTWLLPSIAAAVIGGIATTGGIGSIPGALIGAAIMVIIGNIVVLGGVNVYWQQIINGVIIIFAITMDAVIRKYTKR